VPKAKRGESPPPEQARMVVELRRARYGYFLSLHLGLLRAPGYSPTAIAAGLCCSRASGYRAVHPSHAGQGAGLRASADVAAGRPARGRTGFAPSLKRAGLTILPSAPRLFGWGRTRWRCATGAIDLYKRRRSAVSGEAVRRWVQEWGWWTRRLTTPTRGR
jgi:hypothetical protein